jgi:hypothetical protein
MRIQGVNQFRGAVALDEHRKYRLVHLSSLIVFFRNVDMDPNHWMYYDPGLHTIDIVAELEIRVK